jgi:ferredoxin
MKGSVDKDTCIGCGLCESFCPKVFKMNGDGVAEAIDEEIDPAAIDEAKDAESQCPVEAIKVKE